MKKFSYEIRQQPSVNRHLINMLRHLFYVLIENVLQQPVFNSLRCCAYLKLLCWLPFINCSLILLIRHSICPSIFPYRTLDERWIVIWLLVSYVVRKCQSTLHTNLQVKSLTFHYSDASSFVVCLFIAVMCIIRISVSPTAGIASACIACNTMNRIRMYQMTYPHPSMQMKNAIADFQDIF